MEISFYKYHGAGNDFILVDNRDKTTKLNTDQIAFLCDRHLGIGADGLMLLELENGYDFRMVYYNSDGNESTMCGNGGRCIATFAKDLGIISDTAHFVAIDGRHNARLNSDDSVSLDMIDVNSIELHDQYTTLNTGSPHYIKWVEDVDDIDVFHVGRSIRNEEQFQPGGINVNFVQRQQHGIRVRTYERGVEDETLSCGTGVTAAAIAFAGDAIGDFTIPVQTQGGMLEVSFHKDHAGSARNVVLKEPVKFVFKGSITIQAT